MAKAMFALREPDQEELLRPDLRLAAAEVGASRLQVNLDDAAVAPAMRLATGDPVTALVSVWVPGDGTLAAFQDHLGALAGSFAGWWVEERRRLDPPEVPDGERADALANLALIRRPADLTPDEWLRRWMVDHTPVAIRTQASLGYVQNVVLAPLTPEAPVLGGIVEELFPPAGMTDPHAFYGSGGDQAELDRRLTELMASVARIGADRDIDLVPSSRYRWDLTR